jgi:SAM-dependent methyltransferase
MRPWTKSVVARAYRLTTTPPGGEDLVEVEPDLLVPRYLTQDSVEPLVSTERFFERLPEWLDFGGKRALDVGCGRGHLCIAIAQRGARSVVGVEVTEQSCDIARATLKRVDESLPVDFFNTGGDLKNLHSERFDVVVSKDSFEHYGALEGSPDAAEMVADMASLLVPGGLLVIGFGPTWKAPHGGHIDTQMPWAHLVFPEEVIFDEFRRVRPPGKTARTFEEGTNVNRMTVAKFRRIMSGSGLQCLSLETNQSGHWAVKLMDRLAHVPGLEEYFTNNIYGVWRVPDGAESVPAARSQGQAASVSLG